MEEELQESEVFFPESEEDENGEFGFAGHLNNKPRWKKKNKKKKKKTQKTNSVPVDIPGRDAWFCRWVESKFLDDDDEEEGELVPPHVVVERRICAGKMAFSVCTGNGRTLKGRDLSQVRNSILRMTGFLEA
ncbi:uncharacterized protein LOC127795315 [Diospyros lotus]|uniref:uncharacterized protein LOC127795315 n=1 Tax=Diospyros lotus TaxID=55363 RepID=UPI00224CA3C2|nr:uncharacterized protein LOC127795315 [Diospyros lotus]